jgi:hypothetical protein
VLACYPTRPHSPAKTYQGLLNRERAERRQMALLCATMRSSALDRTHLGAPTERRVPRRESGEILQARTYLRDGGQGQDGDGQDELHSALGIR